jgi:hypothetical protein
MNRPLEDGVSDEQCLKKFASLIEVDHQKPRTHRPYPQRRSAEQASPVTKGWLAFLTVTRTSERRSSLSG